MTADDKTQGQPEVCPVIVMVRGDFRPTYVLADRSTLGRSPECTIWIMDRLVSRRHAEIRKLATGRYEIVDLSSTYGTFVNRKSVSKQELSAGDEIFLGATLLHFDLRPAESVRIRRQQNRLQCRLPVRVTIGDQTTETVVTDISLGGLRLDWEDRPDFGTPMELEITFPDRPTPLRQAARANHKPDKKGLGVRFYFTAEDEERALTEAYAKLYLTSAPDD